MDAERFDTLLRALSTAPSRRGLTRAVAGLVLGGALGSRLAPPETAAKKGGGNDGNKNKKQKSCPPCKTKKDGKCKGNKPDGTACENGGQCQSGNCVPQASPPPADTCPRHTCCECYSLSTNLPIACVSLADEADLTGKGCTEACGSGAGYTQFDPRPGQASFCATDYRCFRVNCPVPV